MADKTVTDYTLKMVAKFADGDTRTLTVDDPTSADSIGAQIYELQTFLQNNSVIIGDKAGASFTAFDYANKVQKTQSILDLS